MASPKNLKSLSFWSSLFQAYLSVLNTKVVFNCFRFICSISKGAEKSKIKEELMENPNGSPKKPNASM